MFYHFIMVKLVLKNKKFYKYLVKDILKFKSLMGSVNNFISNLEQVLILNL